MATQPEGKKRKTKLEKICELESSLKIQKEENRRLKKEIQILKASGKEDLSIASEWSKISNTPSVGDGSSVGGGEEKLKDALRALKRVTVKQELSLKTFRAKAKQRRGEMEQKDQILEKMQKEIKALESAHEKLRGSGTDDLSILKARVADLELQLAKEETGKEEQSKKLKETTKDITSLRETLENVRGKPKRAPSSMSVRSGDSVGSSIEDMAKLKRELANKLEKIATLEFDLEAARDEIFEMKQKNQGVNFETAFPATAAPGMDDFFDDEDDDEDDFWGS
jgi:septal ring factor EnvC (AmiA/AmiB activator)